MRVKRMQLTRWLFLMFFGLLLGGLAGWIYDNSYQGSSASYRTEKTGASKKLSQLPGIATITKTVLFSSTAILKGENEGLIHFLILGLPGKDNPAPNLSDTIMIATLDTRDFYAVNSLKVFLSSIPRDLLVRSPKTGGLVKINSVYEQYLPNRDLGVQVLSELVEEITGLGMDYHVVVNLDVLRTVVDEVGGVNVMLDKSVIDKDFPGPDFSYKSFAIDRGWRYLDGELAEKFVRTRAGPEGDFGRIRRQQILLDALALKAANLFRDKDFRPLLKIYNKLKTKVFTTLSEEEINRVIELARGARRFKVTALSLTDPDTGSSLYVPSRAVIAGLGASVVVPWQGQEDYTAIRKFYQKTLR